MPTQRGRCGLHPMSGWATISPVRHFWATAAPTPAPPGMRWSGQASRVAEEMPRV